MGKQLRADDRAFVSFEPRDGHFVAFLSLDAALSGDADPQKLALRAASAYTRAVLKMRGMVAEVESARAKRRLVSARQMWRIGNAVVNLRRRLDALSLELDDLYAHLVRDLGVKRDWLEKAIIFRRHLPREALIPEPLNWGRCARVPGRAARQVRRGEPVE